MTSTPQAADLAAIDAVISEMYAMISGPAGPRDWSRQANWDNEREGVSIGTF